MNKEQSDFAIPLCRKIVELICEKWYLSFSFVGLEWKKLIQISKKENGMLRVHSLGIMKEAEFTEKRFYILD